MTERVPTPELDKMVRLQDKSAVLSDFYDWLHENGYWIARYESVEGYRDPVLMVATKSPGELFADFLGIDLNKVEEERRMLIEEIRQLQERKELL